MTKKRRCPECNQWLDMDTIDCDCGWHAVKTNTPIVSDHRCVYQDNGQRCPYPGTVSSSTHASAIWHCLEHHRNLNNREKCLEILMNAEKDFIAVMEERIHWTIKLTPEEYAKVKKAIRDLHFKLFGRGRINDQANK